MARIDSVTDAELLATLLEDARDWDGSLFLSELDDPVTVPPALSPTPVALQATLTAFNTSPPVSPPDEGYPSNPDGSDGDDNRIAIQNAALHRLSQRLGRSLWQPRVGLDLSRVYGQNPPGDEVTEICARALRDDADWYRVASATWRYHNQPPIRRDWIVVTLIAQNVSDPAPIFVEFEVT